MYHSSILGLPPQYPRQNAQLNGMFDFVGDAFNSVVNAVDSGFAALDPTDHNSWVGTGLHNVADFAGDVTGIDAQQFQQVYTMVAGTVLNIVAPGAGTAFAALSNATWGAGLAAGAAETHASAVSDQMNANIEKAKTERLAGIEAVASALAKDYPASPELVSLYRKGATDALDALFSGDVQAKVNPTSIAALDAIIKGSLISAQKLAAQQKKYELANLSTSGDTATEQGGGDTTTQGGALSKAGTKTAGSDNTLMYVGIGVGVLAVVGGGIAIYMKNKKKKDV